MNWASAIERNRKALLRILALMVAAVGMTSDGTISGHLPRVIRNGVQRILRPAESAARRLIMVAAQEISVQPRPVSPAPTAPIPRDSGARSPAFALLDPLKRFGPATRHPAGPGPRIGLPGVTDPVFDSTASRLSDTADGPQHLHRRLHALQAALDDLPAQARRLARWKAKRRLASSGRLSPLRPGSPPGHRARAVHAVDAILSDCHALARLTQEAPNTS